MSGKLGCKATRERHQASQREREIPSQRARARASAGEIESGNKPVREREKGGDAKKGRSQRADQTDNEGCAWPELCDEKMRQRCKTSELFRSTR